MVLLAYGALSLIVFAFGVSIGSFLNVLVYRIPLHISVARGRSFCPKCNHALAARDLVPLFSWLALRGKCRYCKAPISARYFLVELTMGLLAVLCFLLFPPQVAALYALVAAILIVVTLIDADTQEIPDRMNVALLAAGVAAIFLVPEVTLLSRVIGFFTVSVPLLVIALLIAGAFGMGDVKLMAAAGFLLGWKGALVALFIALILGGVYGVYLLATKKKGRKEHFAFGPALCVGVFVSLLFGVWIIDWYFTLF
jgi:leader peptidase (prepilin peptidase)/N-methyltransferase